MSTSPTQERKIATLGFFSPKGGRSTTFKRVTIREVGDRWLNPDTGQYYKTAIGALKAIRRAGRLSVAANGIHFTSITWETRTPVGAAVVKAITN